MCSTHATEFVLTFRRNILPISLDPCGAAKAAQVATSVLPRISGYLLNFLDYRCYKFHSEHMIHGFERRQY
jgi:hypothetical protein